MTVLQDNRKFQAMTVAEADAIFQRIALLEATIKRESSAADKKKAEIAIALQEKIAPALEERDELVETLTFYIQANPDRFIKPRKHKVGEMGAYGIETDPAKTVINDKLAVVEYAREHGLDLYEEDFKVNKKAVETAISVGHKIPGAKIIPAGDVAKYKVAQSYIESLLLNK